MPQYDGLYLVVEIGLDVKGGFLPEFERCLFEGKGVEEVGEVGGLSGEGGTI